MSRIWDYQEVDAICPEAGGYWWLAMMTAAVRWTPPCWCERWLMSRCWMRSRLYVPACSERYYWKVFVRSSGENSGKRFWLSGCCAQKAPPRQFSKAMKKQLLRNNWNSLRDFWKWCVIPSKNRTWRMKVSTINLHYSRHLRSYFCHRNDLSGLPTIVQEFLRHFFYYPRQKW